MRRIDFIGVHCSASDNPAHDNIETITKWHKQRGFSSIGYNAFITKDGKVHKGRPEDLIPAHIKGFNKNSLGICLSGLNNFTEAQFISLEKWLKTKCQQYNLEKKDILGHCQLDKNKTCPNFDLHKLISSWEWH